MMIVVDGDIMYGACQKITVIESVIYQLKGEQNKTINSLIAVLYPDL